MKEHYNNSYPSKHGWKSKLEHFLPLQVQEKHGTVQVGNQPYLSRPEIAGNPFYCQLYTLAATPRELVTQRKQNLFHNNYRIQVDEKIAKLTVICVIMSKCQKLGATPN